MAVGIQKSGKFRFEIFKKEESYPDSHGSGATKWRTRGEEFRPTLGSIFYSFLINNTQTEY